MWEMTGDAVSDEMYTTKQAALFLGVEERDVRLLVRAGRLRAWHLPSERGLLIRKVDLEKLKEESKDHGKADNEDETEQS